MNKLTQIAVGALFSVSALMSSTAVAEGDVSFNVGYASEYYFRGICRRTHPRVPAQTTRTVDFMLEPGQLTWATV